MVSQQVKGKLIIQTSTFPTMSMNDFESKNDDLATPLLVEAEDIYVENEKDIYEENKKDTPSEAVPLDISESPTDEEMKNGVIKSGLIWGAVGLIILGPIGGVAGGFIAARVTKKRLQKKHNVTMQILAVDRN
jgi:hypothetical protein